MDQQTPSENPYSSPNPGATPAQEGRITGAVWENDRVTIEYERVLEDHVIVEWFRMQHHRSRGKEILRLAFIVSGALMVLWLFSQMAGGLNPTVLVVVVGYFAFMVWALSRRRRLHMVRRVLKRLLTNDAQEYLTTLRVVFSQDGFDCVSQWERRLRRWSAVERLISLGDHFLFVHGGVVTLVIPKRVFAHSGETERFLDWIRAQVPVDVV